MKTIVIVLTLVALLVPLVFVLNSDVLPTRLEVITQEHKPLLMGVIPYLQPEQLKKEILPITEYLSLKLKRRVQFIAISDYEGLGRLLELNRIQIAWFSDTSFRKLKKENAWEVLCRPVQHGNVVYRGQIVTRKDSGLNNIGDLQGKIFAYVDRYSGSGFYYPNLMLDRQGIKPLEFFRAVVFSQSHRNSIIGVIKGNYDAAAVFSASLLDKENNGESSLEELKVIARTDPIPNDPMVVRADFDHQLKQQIAKAMLSMHEDPQGKEFLAQLTQLRGTERFIDETEVQKIIKLESELP